MNLLFVCTGNTCRSPMAEFIMKAMAGSQPCFAGMRIGSAGITAINGAPMASTAEQALAQMGIPFTAHSARRLTPALVTEADYIFALEANHLRQIERLCPADMPRAHTLKGFAAGIAGMPDKDGYDIKDPYGQPLTVYNDVAQEIAHALKQLINRLS